MQTSAKFVRSRQKRSKLILKGFHQSKVVNQ
jgi:hypothetical protein